MIDIKKLGSKKIGASEKFPDKTSVNLLVKDKGVSNTKVQILIFAIFIIILAVFVKFMVIDLIKESVDAQNSYESMQSSISTLKANNTDYPKVLAEYSHYGNGYLNSEEKSEHDRKAIMDTIDSDVLSKGDIQGIEISGNVAKITIDNVSLKTVSSIVSELEADSDVSYVTVSTAGTSENNSKVTATLAIHFKSAGGDE